MSIILSLRYLLWNIVLEKLKALSIIQHKTTIRLHIILSW